MSQDLFKSFGINIAKLVNDNLGGAVLTVTLTKKTVGDRTSGNLSGGRSISTTDYSCKGFVDVFEDSQIDGTTVKRGDRKVVILGASLPSGIAPEPDDTITIEGETLEVVGDGVRRDPASATYECQCR